MITTLFQYANFWQEQFLKKGEFKTHLEILNYAARKLTEGYSSLEEANEEQNDRLDAWGNQISNWAVFDAVNYLKNQHAK